MIRVFSYKSQKAQPQIGVEWQERAYNFTRAYEIFKQITMHGQGPQLPYLQVLLELELFDADVFDELFFTLQKYRPLKDLEIQGMREYLVPIERPAKVLCIGRNYGRHAQELGNAIPDEPIFFAKAPSAMIPSGGTIRLPRNIGAIHHEGELAVVIGKAGKKIDEKTAMENIAGYTLLIDVTARDLQAADKKKSLPWFRSKSFDTFCPIGPNIVPRQCVSDVHDLELTLRVNGETRQRGHTGDMLFSIPKLISYLSEHLTLNVGDIIATGTPEGVGLLQAGDVVELEIPGFGILKCPVDDA